MTDIGIGDIRLYDDFRPSLTAGTWYASVTHELQQADGTVVNTDALAAAQELVVSAPQFAIDTTAVVATYPPDASTGRFAEVLPHVVLSDPMLPWERTIGTAGAPWLALLVLSDDELVGDATSATHAVTATVGDLLAAQPGVRKPAVTPSPDVATTDPCTYVLVPATVFADVTPRLDEVAYLAHCRQVNTGDKVIAGLDEDGMFSVVASSRFPAAPPEGSTAPARNVAHLVSLEGLDDLLTGTPDLGGATAVALVSLASWSFWVQPDGAADFRALAAGLVAGEVENGAQVAGDLLLRLPPPYAGSTDPDQAEVRKRFAEGFAPATYYTRSGESTFAWVRGPVTPVVPGPLASGTTLATADAAMAYDAAHGVFDVSLAVAFDAGRAAALSDKAFGQRLLELRQRVHAVTDAMLARLAGDAFSASALAEVDPAATAQQELATILDQQLLADAGAGPAPVAPPAPAPAVTARDASPQAALAAFVADPATQDTVVALVAEDAAPVAEWLARLLLLYDVPFAALVPDERMLPPESVRFGYLDATWLEAMVDGALSLGVESSLQAAYGDMVRDLLLAGANEAARIQRDVLRGVAPSTPDPAGGVVVSAMLLRSALVSGWPNLAVRPAATSGAAVPILRMDRLAPTVLLCLFYGVPAAVDLCEPQEGFRFGMDDSGETVLRNVLPGAAGGLAVGAPIPGAAGFPVRDHLRPGGRTLDLAPGSPAGLLASLATALGTALGEPVATLGPADLALQLVDAPESVRFAQGGGS